MGQLEKLADLKHRISSEAYHRMAEAGVFRPEARVELIEGGILDRAPIGKLHASMVNRLNRLCFLAAGERVIVQVQGPLALGEHSEPVPDLALLKPRRDFYRDALPVASDVLLLIEVSDTSERYDRRVKVPFYARHRIPEVWVIDLQNGLVHFYRGPSGETFDDISGAEHPGLTPVAALPGTAIDLSSLF